MSKFPLFNEGGSLLLAGIFVILFWLQSRFPLRREHFSIFRRLVRDGFLSVPGFLVVRFAMLPFPVAVACWVLDGHVSLLNWRWLPLLVVWISTFWSVDY